MTLRLPRVPHPDALVWVFDLDNTLYPASCNLFAEVDRRIATFIVETLGVEFDEAFRLQKHYYLTYGTTLRGLMLEHRLDTARYLDYVHAIDVTPVDPAPRLGAAMARLPGRRLIFTNGSRRHAENVMGRLGVTDHVEDIFDIVAADYIPKPDPACYARFLDRHDIDPVAATMFEDLPKNLVPAAALGMTTVLVTGNHALGDELASGAHIHHVTDDLTAWLEAALAALTAAPAASDGPPP